MRTIKKSEEKKKNVVPRQNWSAATFFSHQIKRSDSGWPATSFVYGFQKSRPNHNTTLITEVSAFALKSDSSGTQSITVSYKRQMEFRERHGQEDIFKKTRHEFMKAASAWMYGISRRKYIQGSASNFSVSVKDNLSGFIMAPKNLTFRPVLK